MTTVCVDGHNLMLAQGSGISTYARSLIEAIRTNGANAQVLYGPPAMPPEPLLLEAQVEDAFLKRLPAGFPFHNRRFRTAMARFGRTAEFAAPSGKIHWPEGVDRPPADGFWFSEDIFRVAARAFNRQRIVTPVRFRKGDAPAPDVMHWTYPMPLLARGPINLCTIHDLIPLKLPHTTLDDRKRFFDLCQRVVKTADHILTVSETTRDDVISMLGVEPDRVTNTWQAADVPHATLERDEKTLQDELDRNFDLSWKSYFIFFGAIEPKKNLGRLIEAYLRSGVKTPFVIVGGRGWLNDDDLSLIRDLTASESAVGKQIRWYDYLPRSILLDLVRGAKATLFPSLYEGFGLPALESMMLGTPVLASTTGSLPEVCADAAVLIDPYDIADIARGIRTLDVDKDYRDALAEAGRARATIFSPRAYADRLGIVYRTLGIA